MTITSNTLQVEPTKPIAPTPPEGGNIENRQPPAKPQAPQNVESTSTEDSNTTKNSHIIDTYA